MDLLAVAMNDHPIVEAAIALLGAAVAGVACYARSRVLLNEIERYRVAFDLAPCPMWLKSPEGLILAVNKQFTDHFGLTMADYVGLSLHEQHELWQGSDGTEFDETDATARASDDVVLTVMQLRAPKPGASQLPDPRRVYEYFISKRRFPIRTVWGSSYGTIGSAVSIESALRYAEKARARHEEIAERNPILHAIAEMSRKMDQGNQAVNDRIDLLAERMDELDQDVGILAQGREDLTRTRDARRGAEKFEEFEK